ncbi:2-C-methyl-D-erythritol 4-phosphate cytidylyltransferase [Achromatium sp. WMS2]|nr:2-C-methyl-D-erythritol 4-phosphate cytidylyltransferase [Achromatium sp. WMS2]
MNSGSNNYFAIIPAAGVGQRMGGPIPKQYLNLNGRPVIEHSIERLLDSPHITSIIVAINATDPWWPQTVFANNNKILLAPGGNERCHSVLNALEMLNNLANPMDWVLVHDAVRPCLRHADLDKLITELTPNPVGGLLGIPVRDTMKRAATNNSVIATVPRDKLWHAQTPQMFRFGILKHALKAAIQIQKLVTDEAEAVELAGYQPTLISGHLDNIKITHPEDLELAALFCNHRCD